jgi:hypothetical protein
MFRTKTAIIKYITCDLNTKLIFGGVGMSLKNRLKQLEVSVAEKEKSKKETRTWAYWWEYRDIGEEPPEPKTKPEYIKKLGWYHSKAHNEVLDDLQQTGEYERLKAHHFYALGLICLCIPLLEKVNAYTKNMGKFDELPDS